MPRLMTIIIAFQWAALLCLGGAVQVGSPSLAEPGSVMDIALTGGSAAVQFIAALAFVWAMVSVLLQSDSEEAGQGDVCKIAICAGLIATTVAALQPATLGDVGRLQLYVLQFAGLLVSHLIMQSERPAVTTRTGANDNSRSAARLMAVLAATDAKINRMARSGFQGPGDFTR